MVQIGWSRLSGAGFEGVIYGLGWYLLRYWTLWIYDVDLLTLVKRETRWKVRIWFRFYHLDIDDMIDGALCFWWVGDQGPSLSRRCWVFFARRGCWTDYVKALEICLQLQWLGLSLIWLLCQYMSWKWMIIPLAIGVRVSHYCTSVS